MSVKELVYRAFKVYFVLVTCILAVIYILGMNFDPDAKFGYEALLSPFKYALLGIIPTLVLYSKNELSVKQLIIRKIIQLSVIEAEIMAVAVSSAGINTDDPKVVFAFIVSVLIVYVLANVMSYISEYISAKKLTSELMSYQESTK